MVLEIGKEQVVLNVCSEINEWMDALFVVNKENANEAKEILDDAFYAWFKLDDDDESLDEPYGDFLERALRTFGINYTVYYSKEEPYTPLPYAK